MSDRKKYLGDGVYCDVENGMLLLTTDNGIQDTNQIYLEPEVMERLIRFYKEVTEGK